MHVKKNIIIALLFISSICFAKKNLNILFFDNKIPGAEQSNIINQITGLIDRGHTVFCYASSSDEPLIPHPDFVKYNLSQRFLTKNNLLNFLPTCDLIICERGTSGINCCTLINQANYTGKIITCLRGADITKQKNIATTYKKLFKRGDLFLPVCDSFKNILIKAGCPAEKILVHPSSIDVDRFYFKERTPKNNDNVILVSVSRLVEKKGLIYTIQALDLVCKKYKNIKYWIIGAGADEKKLKELVDQLGLSKNIFFLGHKSQQEVAELLHQADIFVLPSVMARNGDKEGIPNALREAMATGLPVISTYHSGIPELVENGVSGFLVPEKDITALADRIEYLLEHQTIWSAMGAVGRKNIEEKFDKKIAIDELERLLLVLCNKC